MRIRFTGPGVVRRLVGTYEWSSETEFVQDVDAATAAELLTSPGDTFAITPDEPLLALRGIDATVAAELALAGVGSMADLAVLDDQVIRQLASTIGAGKRQIKRWVEKARRDLAIDVEQEVIDELRR